jgi:fatty-acyl-CoA synthase
VIPCEHFDPEAVLRAVAQERCTAIHGAPPMFIAELEHPSFPQHDLRTLRTGIMAGAPCPPPLMRRVMEQMHCAEILIGYGETEASPITHLTERNDSLERRTETVGRNLPHQEVKVVDIASGATVPTGEIGEICFRGYHVMQGYYGDPEATAKAVDASGWLHSGDLGTMDADGYVRITGRTKDVIIRGGENIPVIEVENLLYRHPKVQDAAVVAMPDARLGERACAFVVPRPNERPTFAELTAFLAKEGMAKSYWPERLELVEAMPRTPSGKIQKFKLRELFS